MEFWKRTLNLVPGRPASAPNQLRSSSPSLLSVVPLGCATLQATFTKRNTQMEPSGRVASMGPIGTSRSVAASTSPSRRWRMQFGQGAYLELHANPHDAALEDEDEAPCEPLSIRYADAIPRRNMRRGGGTWRLRLGCEVISHPGIVHWCYRTIGAVGQSPLPGGQFSAFALVSLCLRAFV